MYILGDIREKLRLAFDMYDINKNGKVILIRKILKKDLEKKTEISD